MTDEEIRVHAVYLSLQRERSVNLSNQLRVAQHIEHYLKTGERPAT